MHTSKTVEVLALALAGLAGVYYWVKDKLFGGRKAQVLPVREQEAGE
jgi:hypothetical protein